MRPGPMKEQIPMPPKRGKNSADSIRHHIPGIADRPAHNVRANPLKENGPDHEVERDFARRWR